MFTRKLYEYENEYLEELKKYDEVVDVTLLISKNQQGINTTGRGIRGMRIFTRQTLVGISLRNILPLPRKDRHHDEIIWDICSIASLSRNLLEGYLSIYYFGTENISDADAELRFLMLQYHRNREWYQIREKSGETQNQLKELKDICEEQQKVLKEHPYLKNIPKWQKSKVLSGNEMYKSKSDFEKENKICINLNRDYQLLSNLVHPLPLSIERIDNNRGRGLGCKTDVNYIILAMIIARKYLASSTIAITNFFDEELGKKYKDKIDNILKYQYVEN